MNVVSLLALFLCIVIVYSQESDHWINDENEIAKINSLSHDDGWEAGINERFNDVTHEQAKRLLGLRETPRKVSEVEARDVRSAQGVPASYDARTRYPNCVMPIRDQGNCGACWSFAGSTAFGYQMCIQSGSRVKIDMSPQVGIDCNTAQNACSGGTLGGTWEYFKKSGTVADSDYPYIARKGTCSNRYGVRRYYASSYTRPSTVAQMQEAIYNNGPIQVGFDVYSDLYSYKSGVYSRTASATLAGGHSVVVTGWGTDSRGVDYWIAVNSWGSRWGDSGAFFIRRGVNMCNIEKGYMPVSGTVATSSIPSGSTPTTTTTRAPTVTTTTTRAPTAAPSSGSYDTRGCWTCPAGYIHWFMTGMSVAPGGDNCACVTYSGTTTAPTTTTTRAPATTTTTRAPSSGGSYDTRGCWTCPSGWIHWFMAGLNTAPGGDACACVLNTGTTPTTTRAPSPVTTTQAPSSGTYDTRGCWTCPSGWIHWFMTGVQSAPGGDRCACVRDPSGSGVPSPPTTSSPTKYDTRGCWTCPAGYIHWFMTNRTTAPNGDKCACVVNSRRSGNLYSRHMPL